MFPPDEMCLSYLLSQTKANRSSFHFFFLWCLAGKSCTWFLLAVYHPLTKYEGTARWRLRLKEENRDKVIIFVGEVSGIFHLAELAVLTGLRLRRLPTHLGSSQSILQRFGISP